MSPRGSSAVSRARRCSAASRFRSGIERRAPRVLPDTIALLCRGIVDVPALAWIDDLGVPGLEKRAEAVVPTIAVRHDIGWRRGFARDEAALRLIAQHRDELGAIVGFGAQRLV